MSKRKTRPRNPNALKTMAAAAAETSGTDPAKIRISMCQVDIEGMDDKAAAALGRIIGAAYKKFARDDSDPADEPREGGGR